MNRLDDNFFAKGVSSEARAKFFKCLEKLAPQSPEPEVEHLGLDQCDPTTIRTGRKWRVLTRMHKETSA